MKPLLKKCSKCKEEKEYKNFNKNRAMEDGYSYYCKPCSSQIVKDFWAKHPEKKRNKKYEGYNAEYYKENKDKILKHTKKYYEKNKDYWKKYRQEHKAEAIAAVKKWEDKNKEYRRNYYLNVIKPKRAKLKNEKRNK